MKSPDQVTAFSTDLDSLVERYRREFDLSYAELLGCLQLKLFLMTRECAEQNDSD